LPALLSTASVAVRAARSGIGRNEAVPPAPPAVPPAASNLDAARAARQESLAERDAALKDSNVRKIQERFNGRVFSVEDPKPRRSGGEEK
jgi:hypothetical protein